MEKPSKLLETVADQIVKNVLADLSSVEKVELKISKLNPPIGGKCRKASVFLAQERNKSSC